MMEGVIIKTVNCNILPVPSCHATRRKHEGWDTARSPRPRQRKTGGRGRVRNTDLSVKHEFTDRNVRGLNMTFASRHPCRGLGNRQYPSPHAAYWWHGTSTPSVKPFSMSAPCSKLVNKPQLLSHWTCLALVCAVYQKQEFKIQTRWLSETAPSLSRDSGYSPLAIQRLLRQDVKGLALPQVTRRRDRCPSGYPLAENSVRSE
ncbi:hypothetical protein T265_00759 [Opisthorchis viverrini]|uniref:Uncharacterized protein n=1 Tax=Opisthorchis viverrini TaxID=6198 RepID=A0A075A263_OPIVI|nr:hypothetical protein T265_00759 [Opisthorchis viverrini]KER33456.1 hypothetical protein T265_00759 [Opisthorchis viverrini]